ncbi:conserved hypothetical protein [groundwater metagenome]|uniref:Peptidase A2 domain-containing protein n=1 Tax=groundwater metagenome TaxID=717931 RepID=A0A098EDV5_9ZZZZ
MICGFYRKRGRMMMPCVNSRVIIPDIGEKDIKFLVDTGAERTVICEGDSVEIGVDYEKLERAERDLGGIGGKVETYTIEAILKIEPDFVDKRKILVIRNKIPKYLPDEEKKRLKNLYRRIPSLLGRDIISLFGLFIHEKTESVLIRTYANQK